MTNNPRRRFRRAAPGQYTRNYTFNPRDDDDRYSRFRRTGRGQYERDFTFDEPDPPDETSYSYQPRGSQRRVTNLEDFGRQDPGGQLYRPPEHSRRSSSGFRYGWQGKPYDMHFRYEETWNIPGPFTGVGPSGYRRSDGSIKDDIYQRLTRHGWLDASNIDVEVDEGEVTLWGQVQNRRAKRMAEVAIEAVPGVIDIHNRLRVEQT